MQNSERKNSKRQQPISKTQNLSRIQRAKPQNTRKEIMGIGKKREIKDLGGFIRSTSFSNSSSTVTEEDQQSMAVGDEISAPFPL